jgi:nicotinamide riboside kinase
VACDLIASLSFIFCAMGGRWHEVDGGLRQTAGIFECLKKELDAKKMSCAVINGDWESRFAKARNAVDAPMNKR